jgi:purine-binding chemotaxis protein CheW
MSGTILAADIELDTDGLDRAAAARLLARRAAQMRLTRAPDVAGFAVLTWTLGEELFALPLADVSLVLPAGRVTPVPGAPAAFVGIASRRGRLLNVVDPSAALGLSARAGGGHLLVLRGRQPRLALAVDHAEGVATLAGEASEELAAQARLGGGERVLLVNTERLVGAIGLGGQRRG